MNVVKTLEFTAYGRPAPKGSTKGFAFRCKACGGSGRRYNRECGMCRGSGRQVAITHDNSRTKPWEGDVRRAAQKAAESLSGPWDGPVALFMHFAMPKPKSYPKRSEKPHTNKPDLDKLTRTVCDGLSDVIYGDDKQVVTLMVSKGYGDQPSVKVVVQLCEGALTGQMVEPTAEQLDLFTDLWEG